ncbi:hypothetical protein [Pseudofrankia asymbiotica]|uniref:Uncharacterized protein n=1 Tax=Pseudofrankia asymbiotica TaxID=1834516 RepID=A0A1V2I9F2_9ACTN|nr:hypothetical protein [Pseudofrankia asymbiotica]ONH28683.1 hypothetical protein BL253_19110 [Pseudofrankia asymbiotica]
MRRLFVIGVGGLTLLGSGLYFFVYLYRWEWNRAVVSGLIFLAVEVALVGLVISARLTKLARAVETGAEHPARRSRIATRLHEAPAEPSAAFSWLRSSGSGSSAPVFIPILMGTGLALSGAAWLVERIGRATARNSSDPHIAARMSRLGPPPGGLLDDSTDPLRLLRHPASPR